MLNYIIRRLLLMIPTLLGMTLILFVAVRFAPGLTSAGGAFGGDAGMRSQEARAAAEKAMKKRLHLVDAEGRPISLPLQYIYWLRDTLKGDFGDSVQYDKPVVDVVGDALWLTLLVNLAVVIFIHVIAIPIAIYSATRQYSVGDYLATFIGYIGLATPSFLLALILLYYMNRWFGISIGGLYDAEYAGEPWTWPKIQSLLSHLVVPTVVIGLGGTAAMIRRMRANLLDELGKQYYVTAKAKGLGPTKALVKYPFRMSLNPFIADIGNLLPHLVSGSVLVSLVLSLPTVGPILLSALKSQDQFLAGFILMFVAVLTVVGMLISDLLLAGLDPRIRMGGGR